MNTDACGRHRGDRSCVWRAWGTGTSSGSFVLRPWSSVAHPGGECSHAGRACLPLCTPSSWQALGTLGMEVCCGSWLGEQDRCNGEGAREAGRRKRGTLTVSNEWPCTGTETGLWLEGRWGDSKPRLRDQPPRSFTGSLWLLLCFVNRGVAHMAC